MKIVKEILELVKSIFFALIVVMIFRFFIAEPFLVVGQSMEPNFHEMDYLISTKISKIERGDVVILVPPYERNNNLSSKIPFLDQRVKYIKRVIGLPNEEIKMKDGFIFIKKANQKEFEKIEEPYIKNINKSSNITEKLSNNEFFVLGDNRPYSKDSEEFGPVLEEDILGEVFFKLFPFSEISLFPATGNY